jgi:predicted PurR-regulated permease PerM
MDASPFDTKFENGFRHIYMGNQSKQNSTQLVQYLLFKIIRNISSLIFCLISFMFVCLFVCLLLYFLFFEDEVGGTCGTNGREEERI